MTTNKALEVAREITMQMHEGEDVETVIAKRAAIIDQALQSERASAVLPYDTKPITDCNVLSSDEEVAREIVNLPLLFDYHQPAPLDWTEAQRTTLDGEVIAGVASILARHRAQGEAK